MKTGVIAHILSFILTLSKKKVGLIFFVRLLFYYILLFILFLSLFYDFALNQILSKVKLYSFVVIPARKNENITNKNKSKRSA